MHCKQNVKFNFQFMIEEDNKSKGRGGVIQKTKIIKPQINIKTKLLIKKEKYIFENTHEEYIYIW